MTTALLTLDTSEGTRRCDSRCHRARGPRCGCICGGRYHGLGSGALERVLEDLIGDLRGLPAGPIQLVLYAEAFYGC